MTAFAPEPEDVGGCCCFVRADAKTTVEIRLAAAADGADLYACVRARAPVGVTDVVVDLEGVEPSLALVRRLGRLLVATARARATVHLRNESLALRRLLEAVGMSAFFPRVEEP